MKVIIAGSRTITDYSLVEQAVRESGFLPTEIVSGTAQGADRLGEEFADRNELLVVRFPANWKRYGPGAGHIRNTQMAQYADALVAVWDGKSRGTANMISTMRALKKPVYVKEQLTI